MWSFMPEPTSEHGYHRYLTSGTTSTADASFYASFSSQSYLALTSHMPRQGSTEQSYHVGAHLTPVQDYRRQMGSPNQPLDQGHLNAYDRIEHGFSIHGTYMQRAVNQQMVTPLPDQYRVSSSQFMLPPGPALSGNVTADELETLAVFPLDMFDDAAQTSLPVDRPAGAHSDMTGGGSVDLDQIGDQIGWTAWYVEKPSESSADLPSLVVDLRELPIVPPSTQREYEMTASLSDMGRERGMSTLRSAPLRLDGSFSVTHGYHTVSSSMYQQEVSRSLSQTYNDNEAYHTCSQDLQSQTMARTLIPWAGDIRGHTRRTTSDVEKPACSKSTKLPWGTITLGSGSDEKIWHIAVGTVSSGPRGHMLRLYLSTTRKGCKPVQNWKYRRTAAPEHSLVAALRTLELRSSKYKTLKEEKKLSADDEHSLLSALEERYGDVWNLWRDGRGEWLKEYRKTRPARRSAQR
jgi:hypothetical protein